MGKPKSVLIIDDDSDDLEIFSEAVRMVDPSIICIDAIDSVITLDALKSNDIPLPDLIFLDLNMPRVDGRALLSEIKKLSQYANIPVIVYSTSYHPRDVEETKQLGAAFFLTKPNSLKDLVDSLRGIFEGPGINQ